MTEGFSMDGGGGGGFNFGGNTGGFNFDTNAGGFNFGQNLGGGGGGGGFNFGGGSGGFDFNTSGFGTSSVNWSGQFAPNEAKDRFNGLRSLSFWGSTRCRFHKWFYNRADNDMAIQMTLRNCMAAHAKYIGQPMWNEAQNQNPDSNNLIPHPVRSVRGLAVRTVHQKHRIRRFKEQLQNNMLQVDCYEVNLDQMKKRILRLKENQRKLSARMLSTFSKLEILMQRGRKFSGNEAYLRSHLLHVRKDLMHPHKLVGKINLLRPKVHKAMKAEMGFSSRSFDEKSLDIVLSCLEKQSEGISKLMEILKKDMKDLHIMRKFLNL